ncbi:hypothetical protein AURDEDRAFT_187652 [Auricularia subglabra TFB-10046 SS5]|nr:hypothetical protein AURDEDRAFT_187652 [Auricularia subglabra TFB-10046 SS5]
MAHDVPPEIKRQITLHCDRSTLSKLALVNRIWAAESDPLLYKDIVLRVTGRGLDAVLVCLRLLASRPEKASCVRFLLVQNALAQVVASADVWFPDLLVALSALHTLTDLRVPSLQKNSNYRGGQLVALCRFLSGPDCPFRLRSLHLPINTKRLLRAEDIRAAHALHAGTMRVVAFADTRELPDWSHHGIHDWLDELALPCATFAYGCGVREPYIVFISAPDADAASIAGSLATNPVPADVGVLELRVARLPGSELAVHFPRATEMRLILPRDQATALDAAVVAAAVAPLTQLSHLLLKSQDYEPIPSIPKPQLAEIARAVYSAGCTALAEVHYPDRSWLQLLATPTGNYNPTYGEPAISRFKDGDIEYAFGYNSDSSSGSDDSDASSNSQ